MRNKTLSADLKRRILLRDFDLKKKQTIIWPNNSFLGDHIIDFELILSMRVLLKRAKNNSEILLCLNEDALQFYSRFLDVCPIADRVTTFLELESLNLKYPPNVVSPFESHRILINLPFASQWETRWAAIGLPEKFKPVQPALGRLKKILRTDRANLDLPKKYILLCPDASHEDKQWPIKNWLSLVRKLKKSGLEVVVLTNALESWRPVRNQVQIYDYTKVEGSDFIRLLTLIYYSVGVVAVDSAPAHACGFISKPCAVIFGPTSPLVWGHRNNINIRFSADISWITVEDIQHAIQKLIN